MRIKALIPFVLIAIVMSHFRVDGAGGPGSLDPSFDPGTGVNGYVPGNLVQSIVLERGNALLRQDEITDAAALWAQLHAHSNPITSYLYTRSKTVAPWITQTNSPWLFSAANLAFILNILITETPTSFYTDSIVNGVSAFEGSASKETHDLLGTKSTPDEQASLNRRLLEDAFPTMLQRHIRMDGSMILVGDIASVDGVDRPSVARLMPDGALSPNLRLRGDFPFQPLRIKTVLEMPDGSFFLGGSSGNYAELLGAIDGGVTPTRPASYPLFHWAGTGEYPQYDAGTFDAGSEVLALSLEADRSSLLIGGKLQYLGRWHWATKDQSFQNFGRLTYNPGIGWVGDYDFSLRAPIFNGQVNTIVRQGDGKILVGGQFTSPRWYVARLNPNGTLDGTFVPDAPDFYVRSLAVQLDGKVVAVGAFGSQDGGTRFRNRIVRLTPQGRLDATFNPGIGTDRPINSVVIQNDGKILIGGEFTQINGISKTRIARLLQDGSLDSSFNATVNGTVTSLVLQPDGRILIGGAFTEVNSVSRNGIARLLGSAPPVVGSITVSNGVLKAIVTGASEGSFAITESSHDLINWIAVQTNRVSGSQLLLQRLLQSSIPTEFLRIRMN